jgi:hypothetical protein
VQGDQLALRAGEHRRRDQFGRALEPVQRAVQVDVVVVAQKRRRRRGLDRRVRQRVEVLLEAQSLQDPERRLPIARRDQKVRIAVGAQLIGIEPGRQHRALEHNRLDADGSKCTGDLGRHVVHHEVASRLETVCRTQTRSAHRDRRATGRSCTSLITAS